MAGGSGDHQPLAHKAGEGSSSDRPPVVICYCRGGGRGQMVGCDNDDCPYKCFHLDCLKLKAFPKSKTWARLFERGLSLNLGLNRPNPRLNFKRRLVALFEGRLTLTSGQTAG